MRLTWVLGACLLWGAVAWSQPALPTVIPRPKQMVAIKGTPVRLDRHAVVHAIPDVGAAALEVRQLVEKTSGVSGSGRVDLSVDRSVVPEAEGYRLETGPGAVRIVGHDHRGVYNGVQTLKQLIRQHEGDLYIEPVSIHDWPTLSFRGVHWLGGARSWPFHQAMIDRIIAPLKFNTLVYQTEYAQWDSQKAIWHPARSTPRADVRRTVDYARQHLLEPIPLVQSLSHMEWLFENGQNLDLAADPQTPYAYNPDNPRTYEVLFKIYQEAIDIFHPRIFHIGHDELTMKGRFPEPAGPRFVRDTQRLHDWLAARGIQTMMWGDMLLSKSEAGDVGYAPSDEAAAAIRHALPKDILVADWHYQEQNPRFPSVEVLQKDGYAVVGTTAWHPDNVVNFTRVLAAENSRGLLQSTWAGYEMSPEIINTDAFPQFVAYVVAAEAAWNGGLTSVKDLGYDPTAVFLVMYSPHKL